MSIIHLLQIYKKNKNSSKLNKMNKQVLDQAMANKHMESNSN